MSGPQTISGYLAALNEVLEVGLRSRRRILSEVSEHLSQSAHERLAVGVDAHEAERAAIVAFGEPEEVAGRFEAGVIGALDRRLALSARWFYRWITQRAWAGAVFGMAVALLLAGAFAALAALFGRSVLLAAGPFVGVAAAWPLIYIAWPGLRRDCQSMLSDRTSGSVRLPMLLVHPASMGCVVLISGEDPYAFWNYASALALVFGTWYATQLLLIEGALKRATGRYAGETDDDRRRAWGTDHPWLDAVADVAPMPLGLVVFATAHSGPADVRLALAMLVISMSSLAMAALRLERSRREKHAYQHAFTSGHSDW